MIGEAQRAIHDSSIAVEILLDPGVSVSYDNVLCHSIKKIMGNKQLNMNANNGFSIYHDLLINGSPSQVFSAISDPRKLENWWPLRCTGKPALGEEYNFYFAPEYDWFGKVIKFVPNNAFHIKMTKSDTDWNPTSFGFDLNETGIGIQIQFWHKGWPECNANFKRSSFCWAMLLNGLKNYVEKRVVVPFEDRE
jgi:uncharacterized protein YndB with AHSA1/START domain